MTDLDPHVAMLRHGVGNPRPRADCPDIGKCESPIEEEFYREFRAWLPHILIEPQVKLGRYRVDFLVANTLVVECDGADFHYRTDEQRRRDIQRNAAFAAAEIPVIRFSGTEITRDAYDCVKRTLLKLEGL